MRRCSTSWPLAALALLLLFCLSHSAAAARLRLRLPLSLQPAAGRPLAPHQADNGVTAAAADGHGPMIQEDEAAGKGDDDLELSISESEMMGAGEEQAVVCQDGSDDDECLQKRLLLADYAWRPRRPPSSP